MSFTWVPFYQELADKLTAYHDHSKDLVPLLVEALQAQQLSTDWFRDKDADGNRIPFEELDPFTFYAVINRNITFENKIGMLGVLKNRLKIPAPVPTDLDGIPTADNRRVWFFEYKPNRKPDDISNLWALFLECLTKPAGQITPEVFAKAIQIGGLGMTTIGLFWVRPGEYLPLDNRTKGLLVNRLKNIHLENVGTIDAYANLIQKVRQGFPGKSFCEISHEAYTQKSVMHWILALGKRSEYWDDCHKKGVVRVGWDDMQTDLGQLTQKELRKAHEESKEGDFKGIREFVSVMKPGDRVFIKQGKTRIIAYGEITGDYSFAAELDAYRHQRPAKWLRVGSWDLPKGTKELPQKTLTPEDDPKRVDELLALIGWQGEASGGHAPMPDLPSKNVILYGPPGTGKTYELKEVYFPKFTEKKTKTREQFTQEIVSGLSWWESVTAAVYDLNQPHASVSDILAHPLLKAKVQGAANKHPRAAVWAMLQSHTKEECTEVKYSKRIPPLLFSKEADSTWAVDRRMVENELPDLIEALKKLKGFTPIESEIRRYRFVTFHQSFSYEDFVEGIKPVVSKEGEPEGAGEDQGEIAYVEKKGVFYELAEEARRDPEHDYALFIDEINRGNVANIFGELITLIEDDKRLEPGEDPETPGAWAVTLPYSRQKFGVPKNLYLIGTMNTADRSVEALDTALRRRFSFVPKYPQPALLKQHQPAGLDVDLEKLLTNINQRLEVLLDKDHTIGHSYLMNIKDEAGLRLAFANKIVPLLQEFFYGNPARIGMVLGSAFIKKRGTSVKLAQGDWDTSEAEEKEAYDLTDPAEWTVAAFKSIYA